MFEDTLHPPELRGSPDQIPKFKCYEWVQSLPINKKIYLALWQHWNSKDLPPGFEYYIVSFHIESVNQQWLRQQVKLVQAPIIVLFDGSSYDCKIPGVEFVPFFYWHEQLRKIVQWFGIRPRTEPLYKFSAVCNRVTQSRMWIATKLLETAKDQSLIVLSDRIDKINVHNWSLVDNESLDYLTQTFQTKYKGLNLKIDNFDNKVDNNTRYTSNPWQPMVHNSSAHFTNESFHYSYTNDGQRSHINPGPFLTEKTMKCLLSGCTMIPVGQFETYRSLEKFGLNFDYNFDTSWDLDPHDISRISSIVSLIDYLKEYSIQDIEQQNKQINIHNQNFISSGKFWNAVNNANAESIEKVFELINS